MTDGTGTVVWSADYKPFGEATVNPSSTITNNLRFPGQYFDQETGLHYNYYRDYNPAIGKYPEADRIGLRGGINLYGYALQNPINFIDPYGRQSTGTVIDPGTGGNTSNRVQPGTNGNDPIVIPPNTPEPDPMGSSIATGIIVGTARGTITGAIAGGPGGALVGGVAGFGSGFLWGTARGAIAQCAVNHRNSTLNNPNFLNQ